MARGLERLNHRLRMQPLVLRNALQLEHSGHDDPVGKRQAVHQLALKDVAAQGVRARLQHRPEPRASDMPARNALSVSRIAVG